MRSALFLLKTKLEKVVQSVIYFDFTFFPGHVEMVAAWVTWYRIAMRGEWWSCLSMGEFCFHIYSNTSVLAAALNLVDHITSNSSTALALDVYCLLVRRGRGGRSYRMMCCFWVSSLSWEFGFYSLFPIPIYDIFSHSYITYSLITDQASVFIFIYPSASRPNKVLWGYIQCILYTYAAFFILTYTHMDWTGHTHKGEQLKVDTLIEIAIVYFTRNRSFGLVEPLTCPSISKPEHSKAGSSILQTYILEGVISLLCDFPLCDNISKTPFPSTFPWN